MDEIPTSAFGVSVRDSKHMVIGCDEGHLYKTDVQAPMKDNTLLYSHKVEEAHYGPVTQVDFHPVPSGKDVGITTEMLFLTASYDWTVKLWHCGKEEPKQIGIFKEMQDYVYDVAWSPTHPSVFSCGDGSGRITLFDLNYDFESPKGSIMIPTSSASEHGAVTRLNWTNDGKILAAGDYKGNVHLYNVNSSVMFLFSMCVCMYFGWWQLFVSLCCVFL